MTGHRRTSTILRFGMAAHHHPCLRLAQGVGGLIAMQFIVAFAAKPTPERRASVMVA